MKHNGSKVDIMKFIRQNKNFVLFILEIVPIILSKETNVLE